MQQLKLRDYQQALMKMVMQCFKHQSNVLIQKPTGAGKTAVACEIMQKFAASGRPVYFMVHRKELVDQTSSTCSKYSINHGIVSSGHKRQYNRLVQIVSVPTMVNRLHELPPYPKTDKISHVIIWDECHHIAASNYRLLTG